MAIIGISGKMGSGKTTLAEYLCDDLGFKKYSFADSLKEYSKKYFGISDEDLKQKSSTVRRILQGIGVLFREEVDKDFWIEELFSKIIYEEGNVVIDDVRFLNEVLFIKKLGGKLVRIERENIKTSDHVSETELNKYKDWDLVITNNRTEHDMIYNFSNYVYSLKKNGELK